MPLFHDPENWACRRWSGDLSESELPPRQSPRPQSAHASEDGSPHTRTLEVGTDVLQVEESPSHARTHDRHRLIQQIKEASYWRSEHQEQRPGTSESTTHSQGNSTTAVLSELDGPAIDSVSTERAPREETEVLASPTEIERPRSALHSGDFREGSPHSERLVNRPDFAESSPASPFPQLGTSPTTPWFRAPAFQIPHSSRRQASANRDDLKLIIEPRSRAPSLGSFSSSYVLKAPTSPLVYQANNSDSDFSPQGVSGTDTLELLERTNRRRTLPPETFRELQSTPPGLRSVDIGGKLSYGHHDGTFHSYTPSTPSRRSLNAAYSLQLATPTVNHGFKMRRPSLASETSPKPHAPMVGSYEESILRGRMSMNPSRPLDFTAQIGVLGKGKCKGNLRCPPHVTVSFPAVFYSYPTSGHGRSIADDSPSPYVGMIDLENSLPKNDSTSSRRRRRHLSPTQLSADLDLEDTTARPLPDAESRRRREKKNRRAESPKCPPGGSYRIPQQGQLQIIIKNPHKTAVKLFLVPYDLSDMEPGTKTFIRQRSYSAGPIIDMPLSARKNYGTDRPEASLNATEDPRDKPVLRYLIHLNICCPSRGRFYLHSSIRVVFANRVPDGKEKLRNEIQLPDPRYSPYKSVREHSVSSTAGPRPAVEAASHRQLANRVIFPGFLPHISSPSESALLWSTVEPRREPQAFSPQAELESDEFYRKLSKGEYGFRGQPYVPSQGGSDNGESLLARRLRGLDVHKRETRYSN
ncbi:Uncharacterized protein PECH_003764 [Penicillium ucsense]|uniref:Atos-like conserved domain-containing protein n=1 Tax=Penicillium ucsense TaxID=2839758 RepID=A0A8J8VXG2_9EURO|nr:Uncharacterized protein PECM_000863 [Penicillium ucsense]KAF7729168.1 Uncharacterized protein PECH_003764 [Penicillium ucsense]